MPTNKNGKIFERQIKQSCEKNEILCIRLNDSDVSWQTQNNNTRFAPKNPCDFLCFYNGTLFPIECKSTKFKSLTIAHSPEDKNAMIKAHQINDLLKLSEYKNVLSGFLINFREEDENNNQVDDTTYWINIKDFSNFMYETDKNSINRLDIINHNGILLESKKIRKYYLYNVKKLFDEILDKDWINNN